MKIRKFYFVTFITVILFVFVAFLFSPLHKTMYIKAQYPYFKTLEEVINEADIIVYGEIDSAKQVKLTGEYVDPTVRYKVSEIQVKEVFKGNFKAGDIIEVKQSESEPISRKAGHFNKNEQYILFLRNNDNNIPYSLINPEQGKIRVMNNGELRQNIKDKILNSISLTSYEEFVEFYRNSNQFKKG